MKRTPVVIAIDGPAASGKSTIAKIVAKRLGYLYIDTGAMYRALTLKALNKNINLKDEKSLIELAKKTNITLKDNENSSLKVYLDNKEVTSKIRYSKVTNNVSHIANIPNLRSIMVKKQRTLRIQGPIVMEGRDITTVVFPGADRKFYLDAAFNERLMRRYKQLTQKGKEISIDKLKNDVRLRDKRDKEREVGGLTIAKDAIYIDTTELSINEVVERVLSFIR